MELYTAVLRADRSAHKAFTVLPSVSLTGPFKCASCQLPLLTLLCVFTWLRLHTG